MRWNLDKFLLVTFNTLILTTIVTACVKNSAKEEPQEVAFKELQTQELSQREINGTLQIRETAQTPAIEMSQDFRFQLDEITEFRVRRGEVANSDCRTTGPFSYRFTLIHADGTEKVLHSNRSPELLVPNSYILRVTMENGGLCREVAMDVLVTAEVREDLTLTPSEDRGYICYEVEQNNTTQINTQVRVNTLPMQVERFQSFTGGTTRSSTIIKDNVLCGLDLNPRSQCVEHPMPAAIEGRPITALEKHCKNEEQRHRSGFAHLLITENPGRVGQAMSMTCNHKRRNLSIHAENCQLLFNIGERLPLRVGQTDIVVRRDRMRIGFEPIYGEIKESLLPRNLFVGIAKKSQSDDSLFYYEPVLNAFDSISREDVIDGQFVIDEDNLKLKIMSHDINDLVLVFSRRNDLRHGIYHIRFSELCQDGNNNIVTGHPGLGQESLCE